jgi:hypothetical protein
MLAVHLKSPQEGGGQLDVLLALISSQVAYVGKVSNEAEDCAGPLLLTEEVHEHKNCTRLLLFCTQVKFLV